MDAMHWISGVTGYNASKRSQRVASWLCPSRDVSRSHFKIASFSGLRSVSLVHCLGHSISGGAECRIMSPKYTRKMPKEQKLSVICGSGMNVVFVSAEVAPWSKTGGLGDVLGGLPPALAARGHRVMTISPRYDQYKDAWDTEVLAEIKVGKSIETVRYFHCYKRGVDRVFVDHPLFLAQVWGKTGSKIYGPVTGEDYINNQLRFSLLAQAAIEAALTLNLSSNEYYNGPYGENVVFVANDWHTALLPCYLKNNYKRYGRFKNAKVAFCVHNVSYQGRFAFDDFELLNLTDEFKNSFDFIDGY